MAADLTTKFATYLATIYDAGVGVTANTRTDLTTLFAKDVSVVRAAMDGTNVPPQEPDEVDDANTMYFVYISSP